MDANIRGIIEKWKRDGKLADAEIGHVVQLLESFIDLKPGHKRSDPREQGPK